MIPQVIARVDTPRVLVGRLVHHLLIDIGIKHPQALVYPLTVATKSASNSRKNAAMKILKSMCDHSNTLVQQARMVRVSFYNLVYLVRILAVPVSLANRLCSSSTTRTIQSHN